MTATAHGEYVVDDDPARVDGGAVYAFLSTDAYWHRWRSRSDIDRQIAGSWRVVGVYLDEHLVGFARAVSDGVAMAYLADVYVLKDHRRRGLGGALVRTMIDQGAGAGFRWMLHTSDAHGLYRRYGFREAPPSYMERPAAEALLWDAHAAR